MDHPTKTLSCSTSLAGYMSHLQSVFTLAALKKLPGLLGAATLAFASTAHGEFVMNFSGVTSTSIVQGAGTNITGQSPFTPFPLGGQVAGEIAIDPNNGLRYWHYLLGDPASGFAEEVYIRAGGTIQSGTNRCQQNTICSASGGSAAIPANVNFLDSNSALNGNATGNPNQVAVRMVLGGTWDPGTSTWTCDTSFCSEFIKAAYANKPKITQGINDPDFTSTFILDLSGIAFTNNSTDLTLTDKNTAPTGSSLTNVQSVIDTTTGNPIASFDMARDGQNTFVTGGKYTYTPGGPANVLGANGTYVYVDGGYDPKTIDYTPFLDETVTNPWAYPANKP